MLADSHVKIVITIDGPASSGKSTVARKLAKRLGFVHLNSGWLFRLVGFEARERSIALGDDAAVTRLAQSLQFSFVADEEGMTHFLVDSKEVTDEVQGRNVAELASRVAVLPGLREVLAEVQREAARGNSLVVEGRDAGTVVFPETRFKFYLDALLDVRAKRRFDEVAGNTGVSLEKITEELRVRDDRDKNRAVAPHRRPEDATVIDTSNMKVEEVVDAIYQTLERDLSFTETNN